MAGTQKDAALRGLLDALFEQQRVDWAAEEEKQMQGNPHSPALVTKRTISNWLWKEIVDTKLQSIMSVVSTHPVDFAAEQLIMFLPPLPLEEQSFVPAMSLYYDGQSGCMGIRVVMIQQDEDGMTHGIGFRIESPTSSCRGDSHRGVHEFYHVQLINALGYGPSLGAPDWLPCRQPSFAIRANDPVDAILNLILSLYGLEYFKNFLVNHRSKIRGPISPLLRELLDKPKK